VSLRRPPGATALLLFAAGALAQLPTLGLPLGAFDEALVLVGGERVLSGELPYRDFYALYPPGQYYATAGLFALFGTHVVTLRGYCLLVRAGIALLVYLLARRLGGTALALASWAATIAWLAAVGNFGYPVFPALALGLCTLLLLTDAVRRAAGEPRPLGRLAAAGATLAGAALFRHDVGAYSLLAATPLLAGLALRPASAAEPRARLAEAAMRLAPFGVALAAVFLLPAAALLVRVPWDQVAFELFTYPFSTYAAVRSLPYPPLFAGPFSLATLLDPGAFAAATLGAALLAPLAIHGGGLAGAWLVARRHPRGPLGATDAFALASLSLYGLLLHNLARVRPDPVHAVAAVVVSFAVAAGLSRILHARPSVAARALLGLLAAILLLEVTTALGAIEGGRRAGLLRRPSHAWSDPRGAPLDSDAARRAAAQHLSRVVPPGERIFVGCGRHDRIFANEPILYFLSGRAPGGKYHALDPGVATTPAVQDEIVAGLERHRVAWVVLSTRNDEVAEANAGSLPGGARRLDDYLAAHYAPERRFGRYLTLLRRATPWRGGPRSPASPSGDGQR